MKKFFLILICLILSFNSIIGQTVINSQYKPLSFDVMVMSLLKLRHIKTRLTKKNSTNIRIWLTKH